MTETCVYTQERQNHGDGEGKGSNAEINKQAKIKAKKSAEEQKRQIWRMVWKEIQIGNKDNTERAGEQVERCLYGR